MNPIAMDNPASRAFCEGLCEGAGACGMSMQKAWRILGAIFPEGKDSDWYELLAPFDHDSAHYAGHQFACVLSCIRPKDRDAALANLFRLMNQCLDPQHVVKGFSRN